MDDLSNAGICLICNCDSIFEFCSPACEDQFFDIRAGDAYCHACFGPCMGHGDELDIDDMTLFCGGEPITNEYAN